MRPEELTKIEDYTDRILNILNKTKPNYKFTKHQINRVLTIYQEALKFDLIRNKRSEAREFFIYPESAAYHYYLQTSKEQTNILIQVNKPIKEVSLFPSST